MTIRVVFATGNAHKVGEVQSILDAAKADIEVVSLVAWPDAPTPIEDGSTFAANALIKARAIAAYTGLPTIADDSGICVDALNGMPGIFSARWSGAHGRDTDNLELLLGQVREVPDERRGAHFLCAAALVTSDGVERVVEGTIDGVLTREPAGGGGFGYDPIFRPHGYEVTTAELDAAHKNSISHRGAAFRALVPAIVELLG
jgi:XTP/dITP diphosphohydrolase